MKEWEVVFVMPNLSLRDNFESDLVAIVPCSDKRVQTCMEKSSGTKKLVNGFLDCRGKKIEPSVLIVVRDSTMTLEALVGFRNIVALSTILPGYSNVDSDSSPLGPMYSDFFDFYPMTVGKTEGLITITPALHSLNSADTPFAGMPAPHLPRLSLLSFNVDKILNKTLLAMWHKRFVLSAIDDWKSRVLFRSLEMAYHALSTPVKNQSTLYDYGVNMSLWVSSLEILAHPKKGDVNQTVVMELLSKYEWRSKDLNNRRYRARLSSKSRISVNLIERLYKQMYDARNMFLHGNQVTEKIMYPFGNKGLLPITHLAPIVYRTGLYAFLQPKVQEHDFEAYMIKNQYNDGLLRLVLKEPKVVCDF